MISLKISGRRTAAAALLIGLGAFTSVTVCTAQTSNTTGGSVTGGSVTGGSVRGGSVTGGNTTGGSVTGSSVTGGNVTGGSVTGGSVQGGSVTGGSVTGATVTGGTVTPGTVGAGTATVTVGNRQVTARTAGSVTINTEGDKAIVKLGDHTVTVEKERLLLDGKERGRLPADTSKVGIEATDGRLTVRADGKEVLGTELK